MFQFEREREREIEGEGRRLREKRGEQRGGRLNLGRTRQPLGVARWLVGHSCELWLQ
jgi:hypothetical protein